jgi:TolB-like protein/Flp pilus assembly protein TadD
MKRFLRELRRRNVIHMAGLYLVGGWLLVQVQATLLPMFGAPDWLPRAIVVLVALGFFPALLFAWVFEITPQGLKRESEVDRRHSITPQTGRRMEHATVVLLALALGYFAFDKFVLDPRRDAALVASSRRAAAEQAAAASKPGTRSIAVLPLANAGGRDQQFFADGLSEALIVALSQFDGLKVIGRNSSFQFRDGRHDSRAIGARLGVAHLLEGSVQHAGDAVRISLELIDAPSGQAVWSQRYDRPYKDLFKLQDEITTAVADVLRAKLLAGDTPVQSDRPDSGNLEAYNAYLLGQFYLRRNTEADSLATIEQLQRAVQLDPAYGAAYGLLARAWTGYATNYVAGEQQLQAYARAHAAVDRALALAPDLAATHVARARLLSAELDWAGADAAIRRALELAPDDGEVRFVLGRSLGRRGDLEGAVAMTRQALATDPLNARDYDWLSNYLMALGRWDEAEQAIARAIELQPGADHHHVQLTIGRLLQGDARGAQAAARAEPPGDWREFALVLAAQAGPDRAAADARLEEFSEKGGDQWAFQVAEVHALRDEPDAMFAWLERARVQRDPGLESVLMSPLLRRHLRDPRYAAFARKVGLPWPPGKGVGR